MAAPTQAYPSWLTPSVSIFTDASGVVTTSTTVLFLPLTYYGPSIPLDPDWIYGGLTSPASTPTPTASGTTPGTISITTTPAIPSTSSPTSSSSATPPTSTSVPSPSSSETSASSSLPSPSSTSSSLPLPSTSSGLSRGQLIGVIVASILGVIFLFVFFLLAYLWYKGRRSQRRDPRFSMVTPIDEDYMVVTAEGRSMGEGSPRHSGEEADPFLQRSSVVRSSQAPTQSDTEMGERPAAPRNGVSRVPVPGNGSQSSSGTSSTNHSGYGTLIERPTLKLLPATQEELARERRGHILTPEELRRMAEEPAPPVSDAEHSPLMPPPRLVDPEFAWTPPLDRPAFRPQASHLSHISTYPDAEESVTLLTARRVRIEDLAPRSPPQLSPLTLSDSNGASSSSGFLSGLSQGLSNISRLNWFKNLDGHSPQNSRRQSYISSPLTDDELEHGKALLEPQMTETRSSRGFEFGMDGDRPISTVSARSGATIYHDAYSSLPGTPVSAAPLAPLPRALTPSRPEGNRSSNNIAAASPPPSYNLLEPTIPASSSISQINKGLPVGFDILDVPAPPPISPLISTPSYTSLTGSSSGIKAHPFPPGLDLGTSKSWTEASMQHNIPFSVVTSHNTNAGISIDVLEQEPPSAGEGWRSMAAVINSGPGRRTTFGFVPPPDPSEQASLYSMRSHMSPSRSTGSAPASRRDLSGSTGSASSRPSAISAARTGSSGHSLAHSGSFKRGHAASPTLSAFGGPAGRGEPPLSPLLSPPMAHFSERVGTVRSANSGTTAVDTLTELSNEPGSPTSQFTQFSSAPWATGLDHDWAPT